MRTRIGKIASITLFVLVCMGIQWGLLAHQAKAASAAIGGVGDTLRFTDTNYTGYTKIYYELERVDNGDIINATTGAASSSTSWADAAEDLTHSATRETVSLSLVSGISRGGHFLLRTYGSSDGTADNGDTLIDSYAVVIAVIGSSPSFEYYPQKY